MDRTGPLTFSSFFSTVLKKEYLFDMYPTATHGNQCFRLLNNVLISLVAEIFFKQEKTRIGATTPKTTAAKILLSNSYLIQIITRIETQ